MEFFKKKDGEPSINWPLVDKKARELYIALHKDVKITFLEIDLVLSLIQTECNVNKYRYLLSSVNQKTPVEDIPGELKKVPDNVYG